MNFDKPVMKFLPFAIKIVPSIFLLDNQEDITFFMFKDPVYKGTFLIIELRGFVLNSIPKMYQKINME